MSVPFSPDVMGPMDWDTPPVDVTVSSSESHALVRVTVPESSESRPGADICCVIDISSSMRKEATYEDATGQVCGDGLSVLGLAKHGLRSVISSLTDQDRLAIVAFGTSASVALPLTLMNERGRSTAVTSTNALRVKGLTAMWEGIRLGLDTLRSGYDDEEFECRRNQSLILLTDGKPSTQWPGGSHSVAWNDYKEQHSHFPMPPIQVCGFGYTVDSVLLSSLARLSSGPFIFIPSAPVMCNAITHALANVLCTHTTRATLHLSSKGRVRLNETIPGGLEALPADWGLVIDLGPLQYGGFRDIIIPIDFLESEGEVEEEEEEETSIEATVVCAAGRSSGTTSISFPLTPNPEVEVALVRSMVVDQCSSAVSSHRSASTILRQLITTIEESDEANDERVVGLHKDVTGRVTKALTTGISRFERWGQHYVNALITAHSLQMRTNGLDFGVQMYGGPLFNSLRIRAHRYFLELPPPEPDRERRTGFSRVSHPEVTSSFVSPGSDREGTNRRYVAAKANLAAPRARAAVSTENYTTGGGGCFGGESTVRLGGGLGIRKRMREIVAGDRILSCNGEIATVVCLILFERSEDEIPFTLLSIPSGPELTPNHPIRYDGSWISPHKIPNLSSRTARNVFNLILEPRNAVIAVDGFDCVAMGHGLKGKGVEHEFYGSERSVDSIRKLRGWGEGKVKVSGVEVDENDHVVGFC